MDDINKLLVMSKLRSDFCEEQRQAEELLIKNAQPRPKIEGGFNAVVLKALGMQPKNQPPREEIDDGV